MAGLKLADNAETTLDTGIGSGDGSLSVVSATGFPTDGDFYVSLENSEDADYEVVKVTGVSGTTFTVTRGQANTTAAAHSASVPIRAVLVKDSLDVLTAQQFQIGTFGNLPATAAAREGDVYRFTDSPLEFARFDGAAWKYYAAMGNGIYECTLPPSSGWSWVNQGSATIETRGGAEHLVAPKGTGVDHHLRVRTLVSSSNYTIEMGFAWLMGPENTNNDAFTALLRDGSGGGFVNVAGHGSGKNNAPDVFTNDFTNATTFSASNSQTDDVAIGAYAKAIIRIVDNGTNRTASISVNGRDFNEILDEGRTVFVTPTQVGFALNPRSNLIQPEVELFHFTEV